MSMRKKIRLDALLVERELAASRSQARALILAGKVLLNGSPATKAGAGVDPDSALELRAGEVRYVSRGGEKLEEALKGFAIDARNVVALDIGASTGGFTDCLLHQGAKRVFAVDVGYGQLAWKLRQDHRVVNLERTNARYLKAEDIGEPIDLAVIDVSFISLELVLPPALQTLREGGRIVALIKPQFEVGKGEVGKGGVVRDAAKHEKVLLKIASFASTLGLTVEGFVKSPIKGPKGNTEFFIHLRKDGAPADAEKLKLAIADIVYKKQGDLCDRPA